MSERQDLDGAVAIIGMSGRFPEATNVRTFWANLLAGVRSIRPLTDAELAAVDPAVRTNPNHVAVTAAVPDVERWDAGFFGYTRQEAELIDPQHRLFLECAWEALEDAGYDPRNCPGVVGVLGGCGFPTYLVNNLSGHSELMARLGSLRLAVGNERDTLTTKVSHQLGLRGPSLAVQSACSTSLLAVHLGCQSLLTYETDVVLAGGAAISVPQTAGYIAETGEAAAARGEREHLALAPDGVCRSLDAAGRGMVPGNGVGMVALKRAADAVRDGDHIYALIIGSAANNDGGSRASYAAPSVRGQAEVMTEGLAAAGIPADSVSYLEVHGSGTMLGDSVELDAVTRAFAPRGAGAGPCVLGSVKANLGHLDRASGVTGLIKTALMLRHRTVPPQIDFDTPNPSLDLSPAGFQVATRRAGWPHRGRPLRAAVNSFGLGGTNAFVVLEEAPPVERADYAAGERADYAAAERADYAGGGAGAEATALVVLSARTPAALAAATRQLAEHLRDEPALPLADVAFTLQTGRAAFQHRRAVVCTDVADAVAALSTADDPRGLTGSPARHDVAVTLLIGDRVGADPDTVRAVREREPSFRAAMDQATRAVANEDGLPDGGAFAAVVNYALGRLLLSYGIGAETILGVGAGARVAACLDGRLPLAALAEAAGGPPGDLAAPAGAPGRTVLELGTGGDPAGGWIAAFPAGWATDPRAHLLGLVGRVWLSGARVDWAALHGARQRHRVPLPTYPFERQRCWIDPPHRSNGGRRSGMDNGSHHLQTGAGACSE